MIGKTEFHRLQRCRIMMTAICCVITGLLPIAATAQQTLVPAGATWRYLDDGSDQGVIWPLEVVDDSHWSSGRAPLGYGDPDVVTAVDFGGSSQQKHITTYFRHTFSVTDASLYDSLTLRLRRDDGAIVYLNGSEILRSNVSSCGDIDHQTTATDEVSGAQEQSFLIQEVSPSLLMDGNNLLAVEVHQASASSDDLIFALELIGNGVTVNQPPIVSIAPPQPGALINAGTSVVIVATASDSDGNIDRVAFLVNGVLLMEDNTAPYSAVWPASEIGSHELTAIAYDNEGASTTSESVTVMVVNTTDVLFEDGFD